MGKLLTTVRWLCTVAATLGCGALASAAAESGAAVADGMKVTLEYTVRLQDTTVVDSNVDGEPLTFIQGAHDIVPGLEKALVGMKAGDAASIPVSAVEAYGPYNHKKRKTIDRAEAPAGVRPGSILRSPEGEFARVLELDDRSVLLDYNHPLAGKNLVFEVRVLKVEPKKPDPKDPASP